MSVINADTADAWRDIAARVEAQRPSPGKRIRVTAGKYKGTEGTVLIHQRSRFGNAFRYGGEANLHLRDMAGRSGFVVRVQAAESTDQFWVAADKVDVIEAFAEPDPDYQ